MGKNLQNFTKIRDRFTGLFESGFWAREKNHGQCYRIAAKMFHSGIQQWSCGALIG
jgi:hypothetical protein